MGEARLKKLAGVPKPAHHRGQWGNKYYCKSGCGTVVQWRNDSKRTIFVERNEMPGWGYCPACIAAHNAKIEAFRKAQEEQLRASHAYANDDPVIPEACRG